MYKGLCLFCACLKRGFQELPQLLRSVGTIYGRMCLATSTHRKSGAVLAVLLLLLLLRSTCVEVRGLFGVKLGEHITHSRTPSSKLQAARVRAVKDACAYTTANIAVTLLLFILPSGELLFFQDLSSTGRLWCWT